MAASGYFGEFNGVLSIIGGITAFYLTFKLVRTLLRGFKNHFLGGPLGLATDLAACGSWAVVTGSTDGIGKAYAKQIANKGLNIVLISRSKDKLKDVAAEIESESKVKTKIVAVDFTGGEEIYTMIENELKGLDIGVLVNNVGMSYPHPEFFLQLEDKNQLIQNIIKVNCLALTMTTSIVVPGMLEKRKGVVINVSSGSGLRPTPLLTVYSATKAYVDFFSRGLQAEYANKGLIVQCVLPYFVTSKMSKIRKARWAVPNPATFVSQALNLVGLDHRTPGCFAHSLQEIFVRYIMWDGLYNKRMLWRLGRGREMGIKQKMASKNKKKQ